MSYQSNQILAVIVYWYLGALTRPILSMDLALKTYLSDKSALPLSFPSDSKQNNPRLIYILVHVGPTRIIRMRIRHFTLDTSKLPNDSCFLTEYVRSLYFSSLEKKRPSMYVKFLLFRIR